MRSYLEVYEAAAVRMVGVSGALTTIGRASANDLIVDSKKVSRLHAVVESFASGWSIRDLGSTNGTIVNGVALRQAHVLRDGDRIEIGPARLVFRVPDARLTATVHSDPAPPPPPVSRRERDVLRVLCTPYAAGGAAFPEPPPVRRIAAELGLSESAVKKHLTNLYNKFGLVTNDQRRRSQLAAEATRRGHWT